MKRGAIIVTICLLVATPGALAQEAAPRPATAVDDVYEPYTADEWIVSPDEEPVDDQETTEFPECDITAVIACFDDTYLRIDILVKQEIDLDHPLLFAIRVEYDTMNEYYTYYTDSEKLVYEKEKGGAIVQTKVLTRDGSDDLAGVTDAPDVDNGDVYFIINKENHIGGEKGRQYYLTCTFFSGYLTADDQLAIADATIPVDVKFTF